ncbi:MAG: hypothetical protein JO257_03785 [Deltaproteobacteria bacterium]|nr:hypothetical protein [Deltaproteobacteria bacterium]
MRCLLALVLVGCATAGAPGNPKADASQQQQMDAPHQQFDAPKSIDAPSQATCNSGMTCAQAMSVGTVSGDTGADSKTAMGYESSWFNVRVTENDSSVFATPMNLTVNLTSPTGVNFDLYVYVNTGSDVTECTTVSGQSMMTSGTDQVHLSWGESGTFSNGADDSRTVSIEVRPVSGSCSSGSQFTLVVYGDL